MLFIAYQVYCWVNVIVPVFISYFYLFISLLTFIIYALDKSAARNNRWRIKEFHLHLLSVAGGWVAAYLAQSIIRHKSSKKSFKIIYYFTAMLNTVLFITYSLADKLGMMV